MWHLAKDCPAKTNQPGGVQQILADKATVSQKTGKLQIASADEDGIVLTEQPQKGKKRKKSAQIEAEHQAEEERAAEQPVQPPPAKRQKKVVKF